MSHPAYLQHHFSHPEQQYESSKLGMWLFLLTEVLMFGGLFCAYAIFRAWHPEMFYHAHKMLDVTMGTINTVVLITSSLTVALAIYSIQNNRKTETVRYLAIT
ncbi:MAG: heme-copper oxidase subunit III, partial [Fidelibacterota bacterium]